VLWKQESFVVLRPLQVEFFRNLLGEITAGAAEIQITKSPGRKIQRILLPKRVP